jgi:hypothetical protein
VPTYDASSDTVFDLRAAVLWCIQDYLALGTLSAVPQEATFHKEQALLSWALPFPSKGPSLVQE